MSKKIRNRFTVQEKVAILRLHLLEHTPVSDLCDQHGIHPTMFYRWQKEFFENAAAGTDLEIGATFDREGGATCLGRVGRREIGASADVTRRAAKCAESG